jgi:hypothetical protein
MTPKEYKNKMMVKVVGSTCNTDIPTYSLAKTSMIGNIYQGFFTRNGNVQVIDSLNRCFYFNLSDVQIATPVMYEERTEICVGDSVEFDLGRATVIDYIWYGGEYKVVLDNSMLRGSGAIDALDPLYKEVKEELAVGSEMKLETEGGRIIKVKVIE